MPCLCLSSKDYLAYIHIVFVQDCNIKEASWKTVSQDRKPVFLDWRLLSWDQNLVAYGIKSVNIQNKSKVFKLSKNFFHTVVSYHPRVLNINFDILIKMFLGFLCWSLDIILKFNWGWKLSEFWVSKWRKMSSLYRAHLPELIEHGLVFEIELMENPINSSPFAVLYPYLRACRWWDMLYSDTKIQLFRHHYPQNHCKMDRCLL